ncbi:pancreatic triacylglycerol lipase-like [Thrips palmi]|uniref:Pancreatic triacylglycerol lipase-like n=1 Tax=Thrips palmi TaxID=161013 RepID=A0A6P8ZP55_THRPL|nr:pancreatic triacylglycerol lipase-like [Thrips palmi]
MSRFWIETYRHVTLNTEHVAFRLLLESSSSVRSTALHQTNVPGTFRRFTGLDPAWPLFFVTPASGRLDKEDADLVDVIHTCAGDLGFSWALGTVDFFPNGGSHQPGCGLDVGGTCSHGMSHKYFAKTVTTGQTYQAVYCKTDLNAMDGKCTDQADACMGDKVSFKEPGSFYLFTDDNGLTTLCQLPEEGETN